jgi:hypothetical protein
MIWDGAYNHWRVLDDYVHNDNNCRSLGIVNVFCDNYNFENNY